jgi:hypothetical protein
MDTTKDTITNRPNTYIRADDNRIINEKAIIWVKKINECLEVCVKKNGCNTAIPYRNTHSICKLNSPDSYAKLNQYFE